MPTDSIFATLTLIDPEGMKTLAQHLKAFEECDRSDSEESAPSPCATLDEVREIFKDAEIYDPDTGGFISLDTLDPSDSNDEIHDPEDK
ncbi:MAG: hypothetical protein LUE27_11310 [Clostridia bacterium]|nr:hypothetical protein [Clostridia bacterium]